MAVMQDWIVRCERRLAGLAAIIAASACVAPSSHAFSLTDTSAVTNWELAVGVGVLSAFFTSILLWIYSAHRRLRLRQRRRAKFASAALNNLPHGIVMVDSRQRMVFCNDRYLEIHHLSRSDISSRMPFADVLELQKARGTLAVDPHAGKRSGDELESSVRDVGDGRQIKVSRRWLPGGGFISVHEDFSEQRELSRQLATTKSFLESVIDNIPVCVAVKNIDDGRYILANRAFEQFSRFPREKIVGHRADEIFTPQSAKAVIEADEEAIASPTGDASMEIVVERGAQQAHPRRAPRGCTRRVRSAEVPGHAVRGRDRPARTVEAGRGDQEVPRARAGSHPDVGRGEAGGRPQVSARQPACREVHGPVAAADDRPPDRGVPFARPCDLHQSSRQCGDPHEGRGRRRGVSGAVGHRHAALHGAPRRRARRAGRAAVPDPDQRGHHRPPPDRVADGAHGVPRRPDGPAEPRRIRAGAVADDRRVRRIGRVRGAVDRPRSLQGGQRRLRPSGRRQAADRGFGQDPAGGAGRGGRAPVRRRVRPDHRRRAAAGRQGAGAAADRRDAEGIRDRRQDHPCRGHGRHRGVPAQRQRCRGAAGERRRRAVPRQGGGARLGVRVRSADGSADPRPPGHASRTVAGDQERRTDAELSAAGDHRQGCGRLRGPGALESSDPGRRVARRVHSACRGERPDRRNGRVDPARGLPRSRILAPARCRSR